MKARRGSVLPGWAEDWLVRAGPLAVLAGMVAMFLPGLVCFAVTGDGVRAKAVLRACVGWGLPALLVVNGASVVSMAWWKVGTIPPDRLTRWLSCGGAAVQWSMAAGIVGLQAGGPVAGARAGLLALPLAAAAAWLFERALHRRWQAMAAHGGDERHSA